MILNDRQHHLRFPLAGLEQHLETHRLDLILITLGNLRRGAIPDRAAYCLGEGWDW